MPTAPLPNELSELRRSAINIPFKGEEARGSFRVFILFCYRSRCPCCIRENVNELALLNILHLSYGPKGKPSLIKSIVLGMSLSLKGRT